VPRTSRLTQLPERSCGSTSYSCNHSGKWFSAKRISISQGSPRQCVVHPQIFVPSEELHIVHYAI